MPTIEKKLPLTVVTLENTTGEVKTYGEFELLPGIKKLLFSGTEKVIDLKYNSFIEALKNTSDVVDDLLSGDLIGFVDGQAVDVVDILNTINTFDQLASTSLVVTESIWHYNGTIGPKPLIYELPEVELDENWKTLVDVQTPGFGELIVNGSYIADDPIYLRFADSSGTQIGKTIIGRNEAFLFKTGLKSLKIQARTQTGITDLNVMVLKIESV